MKKTNNQCFSGLLPLVVFVAVIALHCLWHGLWPETSSIQSKWLDVTHPEQTSWFQRYLEQQSYWLGYSYALALSFAVTAYRRYRAGGICSMRNLAIGGLTLSGFLAVAGCFLAGCCGSPMLVVYLNLFGASFLPIAKPLVAVLTTLTILASWWWMNKRAGVLQNATVQECCGSSACCD